MNDYGDDADRDWLAEIEAREAALAQAYEVRAMLDRALDRGHELLAQACQQLLAILDPE